jgi:cell division protein ZapA
VSRSIPVTVNILGKDYQIACAPDEQQKLMDAASHLDTTMHDIRENGKIFGIERIAVMAALNISNELLSLQESSSDTDQTCNESLARSNKKLDEALHRLKQLEI